MSNFPGLLCQHKTLLHQPALRIMSLPRDAQIDENNFWKRSHNGIGQLKHKRTNVFPKIWADSGLFLFIIVLFTLQLKFKLKSVM